MLILDWNDLLLLMLLSLLVDFWCICIKAFFNWVSKTIRGCILVLLYFALWLVQKTCKSWLGYPRFPALYTVWLFPLWFSLALKGISFHLIGHCDYYGFVLTTLNRKALQESRKEFLSLLTIGRWVGGCWSVTMWTYTTTQSNSKAAGHAGSLLLFLCLHVSTKYLFNLKRHQK